MQAEEREREHSSCDGAIPASGQHAAAAAAARSASKPVQAQRLPLIALLCPWACPWSGQEGLQPAAASLSGAVEGATGPVSAAAPRDGLHTQQGGKQQGCRGRSWQDEASLFC